jgi:hypothetical protein
MKGRWCLDVVFIIGVGGWAGPVWIVAAVAADSIWCAARGRARGDVVEGEVAVVGGDRRVGPVLEQQVAHLQVPALAGAV